MKWSNRVGRSTLHLSFISFLFFSFFSSWQRHFLCHSGLAHPQSSLTLVISRTLKWIHGYRRCGGNKGRSGWGCTVGVISPAPPRSALNSRWMNSRLYHRGFQGFLSWFLFFLNVFFFFLFLFHGLSSNWTHTAVVHSLTENQCCIQGAIPALEKLKDWLIDDMDENHLKNH